MVELDILSEEGWGALPAVDFVVHAAASIAFDHHIHRAITENYSVSGQKLSLLCWLGF